MPALTAFERTGTIAWLGATRDRRSSLRSVPTDHLELTLAGVPGEAHGGVTRMSCSRVAHIHPKGTEIRNTRQLSIVSSEELAEISEAMGDRELDPAELGATMVVSGIPDFTHLPPSTRLQAPSGATIVVDMENLPCHLPAKVIDERTLGLGGKFKPAAKDLRGITAWVERPGRVAIGEELRLFVPAQRAWKGWA